MYGVDLSAIATGEVSMDPENLRFQYDIMEEAEPAPPKTSKRGKPQVYREQVCWRQKDNFFINHLSLSLSLHSNVLSGSVPSHSQCGKNNEKCDTTERQGLSLCHNGAA